MGLIRRGKNHLCNLGVVILFILLKSVCRYTSKLKELLHVNIYNYICYIYNVKLEHENATRDLILVVPLLQKGVITYYTIFLPSLNN